MSAEWKFVTILGFIITVLCIVFGGFQGIIDAIKDIIAFVMFWGFVALIIAGLYFLLKRFDNKPKP